MTPGTEGESWAASGTHSALGVLGRKCLYKSHHWANYLRSGGRRAGGAREETDFIRKVLVTINFCPLYNLGLPSGSTVSEKEQGWERKDARQEATDSSLMMRQGFPELTASPHSLPLQTHGRGHGAPLTRAGVFLSIAELVLWGSFPPSHPTSHTGPQ